LGNDVHELLCNNDAENYRGLDSDRDTEAEVETATVYVFFPEVLSRRKNRQVWDHDDYEEDEWVDLTQMEKEIILYSVYRLYTLYQHIPMQSKGCIIYTTS
jgi:hypothetical protein